MEQKSKHTWRWSDEVTLITSAYVLKKEEKKDSATRSGGIPKVVQEISIGQVMNPDGSVVSKSLRRIKACKFQDLDL